MTMGIFDQLFRSRTSGRTPAAVEAGATDHEQLYKRAVDLFRRGDFREAADILAQTARLNPNSAPVQFTLGATYSRIAGEYVDDEDKVRPWMEKSTDCFRNAVDLAARYGDLNEKQLAIARDAVLAFDRITEEDPGASSPGAERRTAEEHTQLANKYWFDERNANEAIREYKEALRVDPDYALARSNLGSVYLLEDRIEEAIVQFEEAIRRGVPQALIRCNTETWLREAIAIRDTRQKPIGNVEKAIQEYMEELGGPCNRLRAVYEKLIDIGEPAVDVLVSAMCTGNSVLSNRVFELLGKMANSRAVEPLSVASQISEKEFRTMTGDKGPTRTVNLSGRHVEVKVLGLLEEYRRNAKKALEAIEHSKGPQ